MKLTLNDQYFNWLCEVVKTPDGDSRSFTQLLAKLYATDFEYIIGRDANRFADGIELRYRFGNEKNIPEATIACVLDISPCSVLEMMTALAICCEEDIMQNPDLGNRVPLWFWNMVESLGLIPYDDTNFDEQSVSFILHLFMKRRYQMNGAGGLFTFKNPPRDMRGVEIWYQAMWWFDNILYNGTY